MDQTPASPSSVKKTQLEVSERDAEAARTHSESVINHSKSSNDVVGNGQPVDTNGHRPSKQHTPAQPEHLRFGHVDFEEVEEAEEDKRRHYLLRKPKVKQWFYRGKLFRSAEGRASARIEL